MMHNLQTLYRYRPINEWIEPILLKDELFFCSPSDTNDPFDCKFGLDFEQSDEVYKAFLRRIFTDPESRNKIFEATSNNRNSQIIKQIFDKYGLDAALEQMYAFGFLRNSEPQKLIQEDLIKRIQANLGICCFTEVNNSVLMFAHYADNHRGCCLGFKFGYGIAKKVNYVDALPAVNAFPDDTERFLQDTLLTKKKDWNYEKEWRMIRYPYGKGILKFEHEALQSIIFGCATPREKKDYVLNLLKYRPNKVQLYQAKAGTNSYNLEIEMLS